MAEQGREFLVVKYGSTSVSSKESMDSRRLEGYVAELAPLNKKYGLVVVTSGAVAVGKGVWNTRYGSDKYPDDQVLAGIGHTRAYMAWENFFRTKNIISSYLPTTHREIDDRREGNSLLSVIRANSYNRVVSVINENDALSVDELKKLKYGGDNDGLAAHIAKVLPASSLYLMTDVEGVLDESGALIPEVSPALTDSVLHLADLARASDRRGMATKIEAAAGVASAGIHAYIAHSRSSLSSVINRETGTHFLPHNT